MPKNFYISVALLFLTSCMVGPDYEKPGVETSPFFKESLVSWSPSEPMDAIDRDGWWKIYQDPILNALEGQIDISNQNLKEAEAAYRAAVAAADQTRASLFPTVSAGPSVTRSGIGHTAVTTYDLSAAAGWTLDVWGQIRRAVESEEATAEANAANIAAARLSAQAELATDYFALRVQDQLQRLLDTAVKDDQKILTIVKNQYAVGVAAQSDVLLSQTTLENDIATDTGVALKRAQLEHAIAVLVGQAPGNFALALSEKVGRVPLIPAELPSILLERRPDIATAERQMAAANAEIGVAIAAYYPTISLSASYGYAANALGALINVASSAWAFGASATETLIDFGARDAATEEARANFDQTIANYRQVVLTAFQSVEDNLAAQRILLDQEKAQNIATTDARKSEEVTLNQYKEGIVPYNVVLTAQLTRLNDEQLSLTALSNRLAASVALIEALGGGWDVSQLPK